MTKPEIVVCEFASRCKKYNKNVPLMSCGETWCDTCGYNTGLGDYYKPRNEGPSFLPTGPFGMGPMCPPGFDMGPPDIGPRGPFSDAQPSPPEPELPHRPGRPGKSHYRC